jgi:hypothetical protein
MNELVPQASFGPIGAIGGARVPAGPKRSRDGQFPDRPDDRHLKFHYIGSPGVRMGSKSNFSNIDK